MNKQNLLMAMPAIRDRRVAHRLLCSGLITLHWGNGRGIGRQEAAVIEDYSPIGASISIEVRIDPGTAVVLRTEQESFGAVVKRCEWRDKGYLLGIEFDHPRLSEDSFVPDHLLDPNELGI